MKKILSLVIVGLVAFSGSMVFTNTQSPVGADAVHVAPVPSLNGRNNSPPDTPVVEGITRGHYDVMYNYTFTTSDPDGDDVYYWVEWGDCPGVEWYGPYPSGQSYVHNHTFARGRWSVECRAKDIYNATSAYGNLSVVMPFSYVLPSNGFLEKLLAWLPIAFPFLRQFLN